MLRLERCPQNPVLRPREEHPWEASAVFNGSVLRDGGSFHMVYRAMSAPRSHRGVHLSLSTIGYARSDDGVHFGHRRQLIAPEHAWEDFGCEDPRVTRYGGKYYIFYTALSAYPFAAPGIKVGVAISKDLQACEEKHPVTFFNSKAMALFPERVGGKLAAVLTVHTDLPTPSEIALALFDRESDIWSRGYWERWYGSLDSHVIPLLRSHLDQVEVGAPPVKTDQGWLLIYSYIKDYRLGFERRVLGIEAALLDLKDPSRVIGRTQEPLLVPEAPYELAGLVPRVAFPSGALVHDNKLYVYYGAADSSVALATMDLQRLLGQMRPKRFVPPIADLRHKARLVRCERNPIIAPRPEFTWEARATFNPAAVYLGGRVHLLYRAMCEDNTSVVGYAASTDGVHIEDRLPEPVYVPREDFEEKNVFPNGNSGCEDPRLTLLDDRVYMLYTAFNSYDARVALTSIAAEDLLKRRWRWEKPVVISAPEVWDKNACLFPRKIGGRYAVIHRLSVGVWLDFVDDLSAPGDQWLGGKVLLTPRGDRWDNRKLGAAAPPIETERGWLLLYHGISEPGTIYRVGAAILDLEDPTKVIARTDRPLLEPVMPYEREGLTRNVVFPCGAVVVGDTLFVYYGGADRVVGVATASLTGLLEEILPRAAR